MTDLADLSAVAMLDGFRTRRLSPVEVADATIARIERAEPVLGAMYLFDPARARDAARMSEARWARGEAGALDGVPVTIKENVATVGEPMPLGTAARELAAAPADAPVSARLRAAGAVILGKTTMPDYGMLSSGASSFHPLTRNPWNTDLNPGGSSAGAGAAAAAGYGPIHIGTDIGGSIRLPAGWCGVFGLKPSFGRVPVSPPYWGRVAGPMTRTVADAALAMSVIAGPDPSDGMGLPPAVIDWAAPPPPRLDGVRIGLLLDAGIGIDPDGEVRAIVEHAASLFAEAGATVEPMRPFLTRTMLDGLDTFWRQRAWADIGPLPAADRGKILPYILRWAEGGRDLTGAAVYHGLSQMGAMRDAALAATAPYDFVISPVAPVPTYPAAMASPIDDPERPFEHICFTVPFNFSEQPAASVNAGYTAAGLPVGLQISGRRFDDEGVLALSRVFENARGPQLPWPVIPAS